MKPLKHQFDTLVTQTFTYTVYLQALKSVTSVLFFISKDPDWVPIAGISFTATDFF